MLTDSAFEGYKKYTERTLSHAMYNIDGTWHRAEISRKERTADGRVAVYFSIVPQAGTVVTINGVQLYDIDGNLWAEKTESIQIKSVQEGVLYRFTFDFHEEEG
jgi:hypothetical protein